jgi:hypothetical protein
MFETVALIVQVIVMFVYWGSYAAKVMTVELDDDLLSLLGDDPLPRLTKWYDYEVLKGRGKVFSSHMGFMSILVALALVLGTWIVWTPGWCQTSTLPCIPPWYAPIAMLIEPIGVLCFLLLGIYLFRKDYKKKKNDATSVMGRGTKGTQLESEKKNNQDGTKQTGDKGTVSTKDSARLS